jgi:protoporphyrinogen oxidase
VKKVIVVGGGLTGLSGAFHLGEFEPRVFEKETSPGGLCRSMHKDGFTFDFTGHLIHLRRPYTQELLARLLPDALVSYKRKAAIYSKSSVTPYPFQANMHGLPPSVVKECLVGFIESLGQTRSGASDENFHDWVVRTFGSGIARHFMLPYNEKFWKRDLREVTADWVSWSIPKPSVEEVVNGALGITNEGMGYNPTFTYPKRGGIECLPNAFAAEIRGIETGCELESIDPIRRVARFSDGRDERYSCLLSTIPLPDLFEKIRGVPASLRSAARGLKAVSVLNINLGVERPDISDKHWLYFPEGQFVFSRVGFPTNFSKTMAPPDTSSLYIEITHPLERPPDVERAFEQSIDGLEACGILRPDDRILTRQIVDIRYGYVVFDRHRQRCLQRLIDYLDSKNIVTAGRYGKWDYYSMEDSILDGKAAAERIVQRLRVTASRELTPTV